MTASETPVGRQRPTVALVNMPFATATYPSIQLGTLKAVIAGAGYPVVDHYLNLEMAAEIGAELYYYVATSRPDYYLGEWLFSVAAFGSRSDEAGYFESWPTLKDTLARDFGSSLGDLLALRNEVLPSIVQRWTESIDWGAYDLVGFTSVFQQNVAALSLSRRIKDRWPHTKIVFGGGNFDGEMGVEHVRAFSWIDFAVIGEGERAILEILQMVERGEPAEPSCPGVLARVGREVRGAGRAPRVDDMDALPEPDYDGYFRHLQRLGPSRVLGGRSSRVLFESARGCWWGEKFHCTFCGLNGAEMAFRSKSPARTLAELENLSRRYRVFTFQAVDNILDMKYIRHVLLPLGEKRLDYYLRYEVKANLTPQQLKILKEAGVKEIQPGIESFSTNILRLLRKGVTMLQNVRLLKWVTYYGIEISWNLLYGVPGEQLEDYRIQERLVPLVYHLPPPDGVGSIRLDRFSPYYFDKSLPVRNVRPSKAFSFVYPETGPDLHKISYHFDCEMGDTLPRHSYRPLLTAVAAWKSRWEMGVRPSLSYKRAPHWLRIVDRRTSLVPYLHDLEGPEAILYEYCGLDDRTAGAAATHARETDGVHLGADEAEATLRRFCDLGLMIEENGHFLSLAVPENLYW